MTAVRGWIALGDPVARDPSVVGVKAAGLARAHAAQLPVLPGAILPLPASAQAVEAGADALVRSGPATAYLEAMAASTDGIGTPSDVGDGPWVVRSSTSLDDDGRWSGAFASYLDVPPQDLGAAIRGCWASAVGRDVVARCEAAGVDAGSLRVGVLVQPFVRFDAGGTARVEPDGSVVVSAAPGGPAGVVSRGDGAQVVVAGDGAEVEPPAGVSRADLEAAVALARATAASTGARAIEWGAAVGAATLLQLGLDPAVPPAVPSTTAAAAPMPEGAERLARLVAAFPGPLGLELVLPWAIGTDRVPEALRAERSPNEDALRDARSMAWRLASDVWGQERDEVAGRMREVAHLVWAGRLDDALERIQGLRQPDPLGAGRVLGAVAALGDRLVREGRLPAARLIWRLTPEEVGEALRGAPAPNRRGPDRWEPFIAEVVRARGLAAVGTSVSPGVGAGPILLVDRLAGALRSSPRSVLVAARPLPQLAPLLWHSAGLVTRRGSAGAHLFEVARSLGLPTVSDVDLGEPPEGALLAVDGDRGLVSILGDPAVRRSGARVELVGTRSG